MTDPTTHRPRPITGLIPSTGSIELYQHLGHLKATWGISYQMTEQERYYSYNLVESDRFLSVLAAYVDTKPSRHLSLRLQISAIASGGQRRLENYANTRLDAQPESIESRQLKFGPLLVFRLRRDL